MPPDPLDAMCLHTPIFTPLPPYSHKMLFCPTPPLSHFLDEGLLSYTLTTHVCLHMYIYIFLIESVLTL